MLTGGEAGKTLSKAYLLGYLWSTNYLPGTLQKALGIYIFNTHILNYP